MSSVGPGRHRRWLGLDSGEMRSVHMGPCFAVDGRAGCHVADAEFGGELPVSQAVGPAGPEFPYLPGGQLGPSVALADSAVIEAVASAAPWLESGLDVIAGRVDR